MKVMMLACLLMLEAAVAQDAASEWASDPARSELEFAATFDGTLFSGRFNSFEVVLSALADAPEGAGLTVRVDLGSVDTQNEERDEALADPEWFDIETHPVASYEFSGLQPGQARQWRAEGRLTLKGVTGVVPLDFDLAPTAGGVRLTGELTLNGAAVVDRSRFGVGVGEWADPELIGNDVAVSFDIALVPR